MTQRRDRASDPLEGVRRAERHRRSRRRRHARRPCGSVPAQPTGVALLFDTVERGRHDRIACRIVWDEVTTNDAGGPHKIAKYVVNFQKSDDGITPDADSLRRFLVEAKDEDANTTASRRVFGIRKRYKYRARVRAVDRRGCRGAWSDWTAWADPTDTTPPPAPENVRIYEAATDRVVVDWDAAADPVDADLVHPDIAFFQVQLASDSSFTTIVRRDRYHVSQKKSFKLGNNTGTFYGRVRSVDASGNKSSWIPATLAGNSSPSATPSGVTIGAGGGGLPEEVHIASFTKPGRLRVRHYPFRWTNITGKRLDFKRARCVVGNHDAGTHPNDGCPLGGPVRVQLHRWVPDESSNAALFATDDRLKIPAKKHRDANAAESFLITTLEPDELLSVNVKSVGPTYPGEDLVVQIRMRESATQPFLPSQIAGLLLHLEANKILLADNDPVDVWDDSTPNDNDLFQATGGSQPTFKTAIVNALPVVRFNGSSHWMSASTGIATVPSGSDLPFTVFAVAAVTGTDVAQDAISWGRGASATPNVVPLRKRSTNVYAFDKRDDTGAGGEVVGTALGTAFHVWSVVHSGTQVSAWKDGTAQFTNQSSDVGTTTLDVFTVGAGNYGGSRSSYAAADVAEILVYNAALSDADRASVQSYLGTKYGIAV